MLKKESIKETGKFILDLTKIIFAIAIITPLVKNSDFNILPIIFVIISTISGIYILNKGVADG